MPSDPEACLAGLTAYLGGGDDPSEATVDAFGERNPFVNCINGLDGITQALLLVSTDPNECPGEDDADLPVSASLMGSLVARATLSGTEKTSIKTFIRLVRHDHLAAYEDALKMGAAEAASEGSKPQDEARVLRETGMPLVQSLALILGMATFSVPSSVILKSLQHGMDPLQWPGFKQQTKLAQPTFLYYLKPKACPLALRRQLKKVGQALRDKGHYVAAAALATWIDELSELTFEQDVGQYFLDYYNEYMEVHRCRGLIAHKPLDDDIVRRKVLCQRSGGASGGASDAVTELKSAN